MNWRRGVAAGLALSVGASAAAGSAAKAEDFTVENKNDAGSGSLREAMNEANNAPGADSILFASTVTGTLPVVNSLPELTEPVTIVGPGKDDLTVDGQSAAWLFDSDADLSISGLTITGGSHFLGGNIRTYEADLTVTGSRISGGYASQGGGGIMVQGGHLTLTDSEVEDNTGRTTGGILLIGSATISESTISGNRAIGETFLTRSGGVYMYLTEEGFQNTITDSVVSGNTAPTAAGMLARGGDLKIDSSLFNANEAAGGGVVMLGDFLGVGSGGATYAVTNSTISGNEAVAGASGLVALSDDITVESSTFTGNRITGSPAPGAASGAGIAQTGGRMSLRNSIVSGNSPDDLSTAPDDEILGTIQGSFNLIGDRGGANFTETVAGSNITSTVPQLGPLADNGGTIPTMLPAATSPAVNKGSTALTEDARGLVRPVDFDLIPFSTAAGANGADIGAVELQGGPLPPPPPPNPTCETDPSLCPVRPPSNAFSFGRVKLNKKKGVATVQVKVPGAGKVLLLGSKTVKKASKSASAKATLKLTVKAKGRAAKQLKKKGRAKVKASFRFTPTGGTAKTKSKTVKLAKNKKEKAGKK